MASNNLETLRRGNDAKPFQSKLSVHLKFIQDARTDNWSYPRIAEELTARFGLRVAASTIHSFVKARAKRRGVYAITEAQPLHVPGHGSIDPIEALKKRHSRSTPTTAGWIPYDPTKPLEKLS